MEKAWRRFVLADVVLTLGGLLLILGFYFFCLVRFSDFMMLGAVIMFVMDLFGLVLLGAAAAVLFFSRLFRRHIGILAGTLLQLCYGAGYTWFLGKTGGTFLTPGQAGGPVGLVLGLAGLVVYFSIPRSRRGWDAPVSSHTVNAAEKE